MGTETNPDTLSHQITGRRWEAKVFFVGFTFCLQHEVSQSSCFHNLSNPHALYSKYVGMSCSILTNEQNGWHPPERVVTHGSEGPAGAAARAAGVVQADKLLLMRGDGGQVRVNVFWDRLLIFYTAAIPAHLLPIWHELCSVWAVWAHHAYGRLWQTKMHF